MAWIELQQTLWTHRKTYALAEALAIDEVHAGGLVARLWCWALDNATADYANRRGLLSNIVPRALAGGAGWKGDASCFLYALIDCGFIDREGDELVIHDWWDYSGRLLERRRRDRERKAAAAAKASKKPRSQRKAIPQETSRTSNLTLAKVKAEKIVTVPTLLTESLNRTVPDSLPLPPPSPADAAPPEGPRERENEETESLLAIPKPGQVERAAIQAHPLHAPLVELFGRPVDAKGWEERRDQLAWFEEEGATADDIRERAANYELVMPVAADGRVSTITLPALMRHWRRCAAPPRYVEQNEDVIRDEHGFRAAGAVAWAQRYGLTGKGFNRPGRGLEYERDTATPTGG